MNIKANDLHKVSKNTSGKYVQHSTLVSTQQTASPMLVHLTEIQTLTQAFSNVSATFAKNFSRSLLSIDES
jgi:hypothetical protein